MSKKQTIGEVFDSANACKTRSEAQEWLRKQVQHHVDEYNQSPEEAESIIKNNLGYFAGYYDEATRSNIESLFGAQHPIFGSVQNKITPEKAFAMGKELGESLKKA